MYKVFINEHLIRLQTEESLADRGSRLCLHEPDQTEIEIAVESLFIEDDQLDAEIIAKDLESLWAVFQSSFKMIKAAGGVVRNQKGEKLLIKRLGKWDLPKGKMEQGESSQEAAIREIEEECGLKGLEIIDELEPTFHMYQLGQDRILKKTFWFNVKATSDSAVKPQIEEGISEVRWFKEEDLEAARKMTYRSLLDLI